MDGFDLDSPLVCEGIVGDGCGGGRLFFVEDETLKSYDFVTKEKFTLLRNIQNAESISKDACIITVVCEKEEIKFDLSALKQV
jgi:hypothetical protein